MKSEKQLYQWDVNQYLTELQPTAQFVDYPIGNEVIRIKSDGTRCRIPDEVMQTYGGKTCYERYPDGTYRAYSFTVLYAPKPPDYVYTPEERTTFEALTARVDAAIEEIKRRADSGEFTPKKGVDYFTDEDKNELMESVSSGAVGEFRKVVDSATTEYNANAAEKLTTYDTNAEQHTTDYNRNAAEKLEAYNQNHAAKVAEYNQNAETKMAEFDANADALQTEVDRLRGECDTLAAENRKQENRIDALIKLNKGQTYDVLQQESEAYLVDVPSGAKYASVDMVGGHSEVIDGEIVSSQTDRVDTVGFNQWDEEWEVGNISASTGNNESSYSVIRTKNYIPILPNTTYYAKVEGWGSESNVRTRFYDINKNYIGYTTSQGSSVIKNQTFVTPPNAYYMRFAFPSIYGTTYNHDICINLSNPSRNGEYEPYSLQQIPTNFPVLNSSGSVYDYIDLNEGKLHQRVGVVDLGTFYWDVFTYGEATVFRSYDYTGKKPSGSTFVANIICSDYESVSANDLYSLNKDKAIAVHNGSVGLMINDSTYTDATAFKEAMNGVMLYYELAEEVITDIDIPTELAEWLPVEAGGTVTFRNADESKQLPVPNAVSWVRKLDEVE